MGKRARGLRTLRSAPRTVQIDSWPTGDKKNLSKDEKSAIDDVLTSYGKFNGQQLSALSHQETPWRKARGKLPDTAFSQATVSLETMQAYYTSVANAADSVDL